MASPHNKLRAQTFPTAFEELVAQARMNLRSDLRVVTIAGYAGEVGNVAAQLNPENITRSLTVPDLFREMFIVSDNAADIHPVRIYGIDEEYNLQSVVFNLAGTTPVSIGNWYRIYSMENTSYTGIFEPVGITQGTVVVYPSGTTGSPTDPDTQLTMQGIESGIDLAGERSYGGAFTVPSGYTAYFISGQSFPGKGDEIALSFQTRPFGGVFVGEVLINSFEVPTEVSGTGEAIPELTDIRIMVKQLASQGSAPMLVRYTLLLVENS